MAFLVCPAMAMVSKYFDKHRGLAIGTAITARRGGTGHLCQGGRIFPPPGRRGERCDEGMVSCVRAPWRRKPNWGAHANQRGSAKGSHRVKLTKKWWLKDGDDEPQSMLGGGGSGRAQKRRAPSSSFSGAGRTSSLHALQRKPLNWIIQRVEIQWKIRGRFIRNWRHGVPMVVRYFASLSKPSFEDLFDESISNFRKCSLSSEERPMKTCL
jgi:hypothetical protein